jgi:hypothetical protein
MECSRLKQDLLDDPENAIKKYRLELVEGRGVSWPIEQTFNWQHHKQVVDVESWLRQFLEKSESAGESYC